MYLRQRATLIVLMFALTLGYSQPNDAATMQQLEQRILLLEQAEQNRQQLQANTATQLSELLQEVRELRGQNEEHDFKLKQIQDRLRDIYRDIDQRLSQVTNQVQPVLEASPIDTTTTEPTATEGLSVNPEIEASRVFQQVYQLVRSREYTAAVDGFKQFLVDFPTSGSADNALFWMGQIYLLQNNLEDATLQFDRLRQEFPQSEKLADTMVKSADIHLRRQQWQQAKQLYSQVIEQFDGAPQQLAREGLKKIKQQGN